MIFFTNEHVWLTTPGEEAPEVGTVATVGITRHAQDTLGDIVFVDLPQIGKLIQSNAVAGVVESVKTAADVFQPATGTVVELNESLRDDPSLANSDPLGAGWFYKIKLSHPEELSALLKEEAYAVLLQNS
jgi:glycine cleavage system H protein